MLSVLAVYFIALFIITIFSRKATPNPTMNYIPFHSMSRIIKTESGLINAIVTGGSIQIRHYVFDPIVQNVYLFIPMGFLLPAGLNRFDNVWKVIAAGFVISLAIEVTQYFTHLGYADVDDLIMNVIGVTIGFLCYKLILQNNHHYDKELSDTVDIEL